MTTRIRAIWALGTRESARGVRFEAVPDRMGRYVLNIKERHSSTGMPTNRAVNKVYARTLDEAWRLMQTDKYSINLTANGKRALRKREELQRDLY